MTKITFEDLLEVELVYSPEKKAIYVVYSLSYSTTAAATM